MPDQPKPGCYIDTQGMGAPMSAEDAKKAQKQEYKPAIKKPMRIITPELTKELKILINEVLDEREYKKRLAGAYDNIKPLPPSYFDTDQFKYRLGGEEPPYEKWN